MFLKALDTIHVSSVSSDNIISGQTFEIDDLGGRSLIERGLALIEGRVFRWRTWEQAA